MSCAATSGLTLIVFDGLSGDEVKEIVFVEIKTGGSVLTPRERLVRDAVQDRRVKWVEISWSHDATGLQQRINVA
jgi:predicted Holliday junction resolvase-like endonuclease